jgi:hypothetical protein
LTPRRSGSGSITGIIYIEVAGAEFPGPGWSDFPVVILGWWLDALSGLTTTRPAELDFMDGPYVLRAIPKGLSIYQLECLDRRVDHKPAVLTTADVDSSQFRSEIVRGAADVTAACERHDWTSSDLTSLRSLVSQHQDNAKMH